jgi:hypothetical protein
MDHMRIKGLVFLVLLIMFGYRARSQYFDVTVAGRNVGSVRVFSHTAKNDVEVHRMESDFKFLFYSGKYSVHSSYTGGKLVRSEAAYFVNGALKEKTQTENKAHPAYQVVFSGEDAPKPGKRDLHFPIINTITGLYYKEPVNVKEVYSERFATMCSVRRLPDGTYSVSLPEGKEGIYTYKNGQCRQVITHLAGFKLKIERNDAKAVAGRQ